MDERVLICRRNAHGFEVGDSDGDHVAVEADDEAA